MEFKDILKSQRLAHGFTQEELGKLVGLQKAAIYKYENGLLINPKQSLIKKLADVFGVSPAYMLGVDDSVDAQDSYYTDPATLAMAQALHDNPQYRVMFDSTRERSTPTYLPGWNRRSRTRWTESRFNRQKSRTEMVRLFFTFFVNFLFLPTLLTHFSLIFCAGGQKLGRNLFIIRYMATHDDTYNRPLSPMLCGLQHSAIRDDT